MKRLLLFLALSIFGTFSYAQTAIDETFTIEAYYTAKWGSDAEFLALWKKNHYQLVKKAIDKGDIVSVTVEKPRHHSTEDTRYDFRITTVYKNVQTAFNPNVTEQYKKATFPDLEKFKQEEQHRFELLIAHWDVEVKKVSLDAQ